MTDLAFAAPPQDRRPIWGTLTSLLLHGGLALAVFFLSPLREIVVPPPEPAAVEIEIISNGAFAALQPPPLVAAPAPAPDAALPFAGDPPASQPAPAVESRSFTASSFYSADLLRQPDMQRIRRGLAGFASSERIIQICNIEALEQIRRAARDYAPDTMVAYAMSDLVTSGLTLTAKGGAFRSRRRWYGIAFHCTAAPDYEGVTAFDFTLGEPIPESEWEAHNLNAADADGD